MSSAITVRKYHRKRLKRKTRRRTKRFKKKQNIVILGGGGGASNLLATLKILVLKKKIASLTSIVSNSDDGGSTGKIRNMYDTIAWGDITKNIMALSNKKDLFANSLNCRYNKGDFKGHTMRNIIGLGLSRLINCNDQCAIDELSKLLKINKNLKVIPLTKKGSELQFTSKNYFIYPSNGYHKNTKEVIGAHLVNRIAIQDITKNIDDYRIDVVDNNNKKARINPLAREAFKKASIIIISPGHTHGSILAVLGLKNINKYLKNKIIVYIIPFFNRDSIRQTNGWNSSDYVKLYNKYIKREPNYVITNTNYSKIIPGHSWVKNDIHKNNKYCIIAKNLLYGKKKKIKNNCPTDTTDKVVRAPMGFDHRKMLNIIKKYILQGKCIK